MKKRIWYSKPKTSEEINQQRSSKLLVSLSHKEETPQKPIDCGIKMLKVLAELCQRHDIYITLPETIIVGYGFQSPILLYTNEKGLLKVQQDLNNSQLKILLEIFEKYRRDPNYRYIGPLAIKREPNSAYNKVLMKQSEIVLEWKEAYKVDLIMQRYILSKGVKTSKIRISLTKELKIYKIVNKTRQDFKEDKFSKVQTAPVNVKRSKSPQKNIFNEVAEENRTRLVKLGTQDLNNRRSILRVLDSAKKQENLSLKSPYKSAELSRCFTKLDLTSNISVRKSIFIVNDPIPAPSKKIISNLHEYFQSCLGPVSSKTIEELQRSLLNCKNDDAHFLLDDMMYTNFFREKINKIFCIKSYDLSKVEVYDIKAFKGLENALNMIKELKRIINGYIFANYGLKVTKLVCDFIEDINQNVYFLKIKTYEYYKRKDYQIKKTPANLMFHCPGKYCKINNNKRKTNSFQTYDILNKHITDDTNFNDLSYHRNPHKLHQKVKVCKDCFDYYTKNINSIHSNSYSLGIQLKKFKKIEASLILHEINPKLASDTIISLPKTTKSVPKMLPTKDSTSNIYKNNRTSDSLRSENNLNFRKEFFDKKKQEIFIASLEQEFF